VACKTGLGLVQINDHAYNFMQGRIEMALGLCRVSLARYPKWICWPLRMRSKFI